MTKLISARAVREKFTSVGRKAGPPRVPSDMWLRRQIERGNLPPPARFISGIRFWHEAEVDAAIERLLATPDRRSNLPPRVREARS